MSRWYVVHFKSKEDPALGIDYWFGTKPDQAVQFPTQLAARAILQLMAGGVTFALEGGREITLYDFGVEQLGEHVYLIYSDSQVPANVTREDQLPGYKRLT
jgi:hypothetical protein